MNKQKKKKRGKKSVQNLLGLQGFTTYGLKTTGGELVYFAIQPTNISVLSHVNIEIKIRHLLMVLTALPTWRWPVWTPPSASTTTSNSWRAASARRTTPRCAMP